MYFAHAGLALDAALEPLDYRAHLLAYRLEFGTIGARRQIRGVFGFARESALPRYVRSVSAELRANPSGRQADRDADQGGARRGPTLRSSAFAR